jgi:hypothetical protein
MKSSAKNNIADFERDAKLNLLNIQMKGFATPELKPRKED